MGILRRFKDIMSSNVNALLDKAEDPVKMVDQYLRDLESDLGKVKAETAAVMAEETRANRELKENEEEIAKMVSYAEKALMAGNESDAKVFLNKKAVLEAKRANLQQAAEAATTNAQQMRQMHDKLEKDIVQLRERKQAIKSKMAVAKTQEKLNKIGSSYDTAQSKLSAFDRMEEKANRMMDEANAMAQLNTPKTDSAESLMDKYDEAPSADSAIDDELAAMKAKLGL
ncbi:MAG: PspA/IM30 family protein [Eubacterium sp.]|nr:PspA/IM30 family protein [Eubacterium sp.]